MVLRICVSRYAWSRGTRYHVRGAMQSNKKRAMAVRRSLHLCNQPSARVDHLLAHPCPLAHIR